LIFQNLNANGDLLYQNQKCEPACKKPILADKSFIAIKDKIKERRLRAMKHESPVKTLPT
jgi:hypothetical protein